MISCNHDIGYSVCGECEAILHAERNRYKKALERMREKLLYAHDGGCVLPLRALVDEALSLYPNKEQKT